MKGLPCLAAVLGLLVGLTSGACAQERNELTGLIGRTFVSDHAVTGTSTPGALLAAERGLTVEVDYGRRLFDSAIAGLTAEVPLVVNFGEKNPLRPEPRPQGLQVIFRYAGIACQPFP